MAYLMDDLKDVDSLLDEWAISNVDLQNVQMTDGTYTVAITDECSKLNLNTATANQLLNLDTETMSETIAESILDWRDQDEVVRTNGAENGYYLNLDVGYLCRNGNFRTPRENLRVKGMTEDLFYGKNNRILGQGGWSRFVTCYSAVKNVDASGGARVNVNSAQESDLISKLSLSAPQARYITQNRPFTNIAGLIGIKISTTSSTNSSTSTSNSNSTNSGSSNSGGSSQGGGGNSGGTSGSGSNQIAPQSLNSPVGASLPIRWPQFSTVAALLAADASVPEGAGGGSGQRRGEGQGGRGGEQGEGRGGRRGPGQGQDRGGMTSGRGGGTRGAMGDGNAQAQTQPLDWATFSRIFDQITLTDNKMITGQININTVGVEVLRAFLEGNEDLANKIISYRNSQGGEITNLCNLINVEGMTQQTLAKYLDQLCVRSSVYLIRATAQSKSCGVRYFIEMAVNRDREGREMLYKLEGIGN